MLTFNLSYIRLTADIPQTSSVLLWLLAFVMVFNPSLTEEFSSIYQFTSFCVINSRVPEKIGPIVILWLFYLNDGHLLEGDLC